LEFINPPWVYKPMRHSMPILWVIRLCQDYLAQENIIASSYDYFVIAIWMFTTIVKRSFHPIAKRESHGNKGKMQEVCTCWVFPWYTVHKTKLYFDNFHCNTFFMCLFIYLEKILG
jgi:hypothetical protein